MAEQQPAVFDRPGEIVAVVGETVTWVPEGRLTKWQSQIDDIEFTPALQAKRKWKQSKISYSEFTELKASFQDLDLTVGGKDHTADDSQLQLMCWLIYRDHIWSVSKPPRSSEIPHLLRQNIIDMAVGEDPTTQQMALEIIHGSMRSRGLVGVPIVAGGHWTMVVIRRTHQRQKIYYYDTLPKIHMACQNKAREVLRMLDIKQDLPDRRNRAVQEDATSCGFWIMFYWEGHVREFMGEGWSIGRGDQKSAMKILERLRKTCQYIKEGVPAPLKKKKSSAGLSVVSKEEDPLICAMPGAPAMADLDAQLAHLKVQADRAKKQAAGPFYGCPKCTWARSGCIWWRCNPVKYQAHRLKFPARYGDPVADGAEQELKVDEERKMSPKELIGEDILDDVGTGGLVGDPEFTDID